MQKKHDSLIIYGCHRVAVLPETLPLKRSMISCDHGRHFLRERTTGLASHCGCSGTRIKIAQGAHKHGTQFAAGCISLLGVDREVRRGGGRGGGSGVCTAEAAAPQQLYENMTPNCCSNSYPVLDKACFATIAGTKALAGAAATATKAAATVVAFMILACRGRAKR